jgi:pyridoxal phosphate-dependent aminotransferase EpsN
MSSPPSSSSRIFLSPPHVGEEERRNVDAAFATNWIAPAGPHLASFEAEICAISGISDAVAVSSGTAALHLAVRLMDVQPGDEVFCSTFTFVASANPVVYQGARPVFIDADTESWNMDPNLLAEALAQRAKAGRLPKAIIVADIYGQCAAWNEILAAAAAYGVPVIEDAAEAVGATYRGAWAGGFGVLGIFSFNGNKILTTGGGGMLLSADAKLIDRAHNLATQAREPEAHYEHRELGYNYRLSNVLAGIGRGQLLTLGRRIERRREIFEFYRAALGDLPGVGFMPEAPHCRSTRWLTCLTIDPTVGGVDRHVVLSALTAANIEARPLWKPLHRQPLYRDAAIFGGAVADRLFERGLCIPSGSALTAGELQRVVDAIRRVFPKA